MSSKQAPSTMRLRECELVYRARSVDVCVKRISSSEDVYRLLGAMNAPRRVTESMWVLLLDARQKLIGVHECAKGGVTSVPVQLCDVFRAAIITAAPAVILAHNHPSGDCNPSPEDFVFTDAARNAGKLLGVEVLDHIIVAHSGYYSLLDAGKFRVPPGGEAATRVWSTASTRRRALAAQVKPDVSPAKELASCPSHS